MTDKDIIFNRHSLANECMTGNLNSASDFDAFLNLNKGAYLGFVSDLTAI